MENLVYHYIDKEDEELLLYALREDNWSDGELVRQFEKEISEYLGSKHAILTPNGTFAIKLAFRSLRVGPGDEIIVPGLTWPSVIIAIFECGATPVLVDVDIATCCMNTNEVEAAITSNTKAILATHLYCSQADINSLKELSNKKHIYLVEDSAHIIGTTRNGKHLGTFGDFGTFSFNQKKLLSCGEGGCLVTNSSELFSIAKELREVEPSVRVSTSQVQNNLLVSEFQAAVLISQLRKLKSKLLKHSELAKSLTRRIAHIPGFSTLYEWPGTELQSYYSFVVRIDKHLPHSDIANELAKFTMFSCNQIYEPLNQLDILRTTNDNVFKNCKMITRSELTNCKFMYDSCFRFHHGIFNTSHITFSKFCDSLIHYLTSICSKDVRRV